MLVTFMCDAHEDVTLFGEVAAQLLKMMGHSGTVPSAIAAQDVPAALTALKEGIEKEKKKNVSKPNFAHNDDDEEEISLTLRAIPLIALLEDAAKQDCHVRWQ